MLLYCILLHQSLGDRRSLFCTAAIPGRFFVFEQPRPLIDRQRLASPNAVARTPLLAFTVQWFARYGREVEEVAVVCCRISGLFTGNNTGNGVADRFCFSKDVTRTPQAGDLIDTTHGWIDVEGNQEA